MGWRWASASRGSRKTMGMGKPGVSSRTPTTCPRGGHVLCTPFLHFLAGLERGTRELWVRPHECVCAPYPAPHLHPARCKTSEKCEEAEFKFLRWERERKKKKEKERKVWGQENAQRPWQNTSYLQGRVWARLPFRFPSAPFSCGIHRERRDGAQGVNLNWTGEGRGWIFTQTKRG